MIKVGMYIRTKKGIAKYLGLGVSVLKDDGSSSYNHWKSRHIFDEYVFEEEYGDTLTTLDDIDKLIIGKPSFDIIDLIEVGDYVNGQRVEEITNKDIYLENMTNIKSNEIESILTKEQFEVNSYKVGE